jgi:hypothetical protein
MLTVVAVFATLERDTMIEPTHAAKVNAIRWHAVDAYLTDRKSSP